MAGLTLGSSTTTTLTSAQKKKKQEQFEQQGRDLGVSSISPTQRGESVTSGTPTTRDLTPQQQADFQQQFEQQGSDIALRQQLAGQPKGIGADKFSFDQLNPFGENFGGFTAEDQRRAEELMRQGEEMRRQGLKPSGEPLPALFSLENIGNTLTAVTPLLMGINIKGLGLLGKSTKVSKARGIGVLPIPPPSSLGVGASRYVTNTATVKATENILKKIIAPIFMSKGKFSVAKLAVVAGAVGSMIGTYPWSEWALGEAKEGMIFNTQRALSTGDPAIMRDFQQTSDEIFDTTVWENIQRLIPFFNIKFSFEQKAKSLFAQKQVNDKLVNDQIFKIENGITDEENWERINKEKEQSEKDAVDYYNREREQMLEWEREAQKQARDEDAKFWREERAKQAQKELEDMKAIADFWTAYRKELLKLQDDSRPSNLNFGLL